MTSNKQSNIGEEKIIWWKDWKFLLGIAMIIMNFIAGFYGKSLIGIFIVKSLAKIHEPVYLITGVSFWVFSWLLLLIGIFLVGWETVKVIQYKIHHHVKRTVKGTYEFTKELPKKGIRYTKESIRYTKDMHKKIWLRQH